MLFLVCCCLSIWVPRPSQAHQGATLNKGNRLIIYAKMTNCCRSRDMKQIPSLTLKPDEKAFVSLYLYFYCTHPYTT